MTDTEDDYVSFETAKLLKDRGFENYKCDYIGRSGRYYTTNDTYYSQEEMDEAHKDSRDHCPLVTLQVAMKWLRAKNIFIQIFYYNVKSDPFVWYIFAHNSLTPQHAPTYEEAAENAIRYVLENWEEVASSLKEYYKTDKMLPKVW